MSTGTQSTLYQYEGRIWDHDEYLDAEEERYIRRNIEFTREILGIPKPFEMHDVDEDKRLKRERMSKCPIIEPVNPDDNPKRYEIIRGVRSYVREWCDQQFEFDCCYYPDAFVNREGTLLCAGCGEELEREEVANADL